MGRKGASSSCVDAVEELRWMFRNPFWRPIIDFNRYVWVGGHHAVSVSTGVRLIPELMAHPGRTWKREQLEQGLGRKLELAFSEAPGAVVTAPMGLIG